MTSRTIGTGTSNAQGLPLHSLVHCSLSTDFYFAFISENAAAIALKRTPPSEPETLTSHSWRQYSNSQGEPLLGSVGVRSSFSTH